LNTEGAEYNDGNMAETARSINVDDINRVTGYDPDVAKYNSGKNNAVQWENDVTYRKSGGKIYYRGTRYPITEVKSNYTSFTYWTGSDWKSLENEESATLKNTFYSYYPQTLSTTSSTENQINGSSKAYELLFEKTSGGYDMYYWFSNTCVRSGSPCTFAMGVVYEQFVTGLNLFNSSDGSYNIICGFRPVVTLKSSIQVSNTGVLST